MQSVLSDCGEPRWKKEQVALLKLEEVKFTDTKMMGAYLKFYGEAILFDQAVNSRRAKQTELDGKIANKKKLEGSIFRANIEQLAYVDDWKKRQDGDQSITVAGTKARLAPKRTLQRTSSILMAGEAKELAKTLACRLRTACRCRSIAPRPAALRCCRAAHDIARTLPG